MFEKVAISVKRLDGLESEVDPRFGRAYAFLVVDSKTGKVADQFLNQSACETTGAGTAAAALLKKHNVGAIISGRFGPKALEALAALKIEMFIVEQDTKVKTALERLNAGSLKEAKVRVY